MQQADKPVARNARGQAFAGSEPVLSAPKHRADERLGRCLTPGITAVRWRVSAQCIRTVAEAAKLAPGTSDAAWEPNVQELWRAGGGSIRASSKAAVYHPEGSRSPSLSA